MRSLSRIKEILMLEQSLNDECGMKWINFNNKNDNGSEKRSRAV